MKQSTLKSGHQITIRQPLSAEAEALMELKRSYIKDTTTIPLFLEEYPIEIEKEAELIRTFDESHNSLLLVAEHKGMLIGNIDLTGSPRSKIAHTAMLGMGVKNEWHNKGLGRALIETALEWAKNESPLKLIWLDVYASNKGAIHLYKSTGFQVSGIVKGFFQEGEKFIDKIQMYQEI